MADEPQRARLGRGLAALIGDVGMEPQERQTSRHTQRKVPIEFVQANPNNPRKQFSEAELEDLTASIQQRGIIQPIVTRARGTDQYEIIAGERRWRAAQRAGLHEVPIVVLEVSDTQALELAIIENVQRADLNAMEEAAGYLALMDQYGHSQDDVAKIVGKSRSHIANTVRLTKLSDPVQQLVRAGKLTAGHARMLVGQPNALELAHDILVRGLNVRQVEEMMRADGRAQAREVKRTGRLGKDADTLALEERLSTALGIKVEIEHRANGSGTVRIHYRDLDQLDGITERLERDPAPRGETGPRVRKI